MNRKEWNKLKSRIKDFHPLTRIIRLTELLDDIKDKTLRKEIEQEIKESQLEIQDKKLWKTTAPIIVRGKSIEEDLPPKQSLALEEVVQATPTLETKKEEPIVKGYSQSSDIYSHSYESQKPETFYKKPESEKKESWTNLERESRERFIRDKHFDELEERKRYKK